MSNNFNSSVYVDTTALLTWKTKLSNINNKSIENLNNLNAILNRLNTSMTGNVADGISHDIKDTIQTAKKYHENMGNLEDFLEHIVISKQNQ